MTDTPANADPSPPDPAADTDERQPRRRSRLTVALVAAALALVLAALSLVGARILGWWPAEGGPEARPTSTPTPSEPPSPFAGTPAEDFAEGADGIVLPEAEAVGDFTAEQVAEALEQVRRALIAARLDHTMLIDHDPDEFLGLLAPDHELGRNAEFDSGEFAPYASQVALDAELTLVPPRVDGQITYDMETVQAGRQVLKVVTRFVWVYSFRVPGAETEDHLSVIRDELTWRLRGEPWLESSQGLWLSEAVSQPWGVDCDAYSEGRIRPARPPYADFGDDADVVFDARAPIEPGGDC